MGIWPANGGEEAVSQYREVQLITLGARPIHISWGCLLPHLF